MVDETYRRFDSGRFGIVQADPGIFQTKIEGALSVPAKTPEKKKEKDSPESSDDIVGGEVSDAWG